MKIYQSFTVIDHFFTSFYLETNWKERHLMRTFRIHFFSLSFSAIILQKKDYSLFIIILLPPIYYAYKLPTLLLPSAKTVSPPISAKCHFFLIVQENQFHHQMQSVITFQQWRLSLLIERWDRKYCGSWKMFLLSCLLITVLQ